MTTMMMNPRLFIVRIDGMACLTICLSLPEGLVESRVMFGRH